MGKALPIATTIGDKPDGTHYTVTKP